MAWIFQEEKLDLEDVARLGGFYKDGFVSGVSDKEIESEDLNVG